MVRTLRTVLTIGVLSACGAAEQGDSRLETGLPERLDAFVASVAAATAFSGSVLVASDGEILLRQGYGLANRELAVANRPETSFRIGSLTKTVTAVAILQLHEQGAVELDEPVSSYLPSLPQAGRVTVRQLLNHTTGLPLDWRPEWHEKRELSLEQVLGIVADQELLFEPGTAEEYSNSGYAVLARIVEVVSDDPFDTYVQRSIFVPAGMVATATDWPDRLVANRAAGYVFGESFEGATAILNAEYLHIPSLLGQASLRATVDDLYRYDRALRDRTLLSETALGLVEQTDSVSEFTYGGWLRASHPELGDFLYLGGISSGFQAVVYRYLEGDATIIVLANHQSADVFFVTRGLANLLAGKEVYRPVRRVALADPPAGLAALAGTYVLESGETFEIRDRGERLFVSSHGDPPEELFAERSELFFSTLHDLQIEFVREDGGVVGAAWTYQGDSESASLKAEHDGG